MKKNIKPRLFINENLTLGGVYPIAPAQAHYLLNVLRLNLHDEVKVFDGKNGEFLAQISAAGKKETQITIREKIREMSFSPDVWLLFAPVKKDKTDLIIAGATELGVSKILPTITRRTICERVKTERFQAQVIEAAEQCRRLDVPEVRPAETLENVLKNWPKDRTLFFMDETGNGQNVLKTFAADKNSASALLVGPEGGFAEEELNLLRKLDFAKAVSLGKRILRAETAALAALACWQACRGDWKI